MTRPLSHRRQPVANVYRFCGKGKKPQAGDNPLLKEGRPRRPKLVVLPQVIGAAGVVNHSLFHSLTNRFKHSLDVLMKNPGLEPENHNAFRLQEPPIVVTSWSVPHAQASHA